MSWSVTINDLPRFAGLDPRTIEKLARENIQYPFDALAAIETAKQRGLRSCVCAGGRTPSPVSDDEVIDISVRGMTTATDFNKAVRDILRTGPDATTEIWQRDERYRTANEVPDNDGGG